MRAKGTRHKSYGAAVNFLTRNPDKISEAWDTPFELKGGSLFVFASPDGRRAVGDEVPGAPCCLTQLKARGRSTIKGLPPAVGAKLIKKLRADKRIPSSPERITVESLPAFAEWQERLDKAFG